MKNVKLIVLGEGEHAAYSYAHIIKFFVKKKPPSSGGSLNHRLTIGRFRRNALAPYTLERRQSVKARSALRNEP